MLLYTLAGHRAACITVHTLHCLTCMECVASNGSGAMYYKLLNGRIGPKPVSYLASPRRFA